METLFHFIHVISILQFWQNDKYRETDCIDVIEIKVWYILINIKPGTLAAGAVRGSWKHIYSRSFWLAFLGAEKCHKSELLYLAIPPTNQAWISIENWIFGQNMDKLPIGGKMTNRNIFIG